MTFGSKEYALDELKKTRKTIEKVGLFLDKFEESESVLLHLSGLSTELTLVVSEIEDVQKAARLIRLVEPNFRHEFLMAWNPYGNIACGSFGDREYPWINIRLKTTIDEWPAELTKGSDCKWVPEEDVRTQYSLQCDLSGKEKA
jgi:hypothetical protein